MQLNLCLVQLHLLLQFGTFLTASLGSRSPKNSFDGDGDDDDDDDDVLTSSFKKLIN